MGKILFYKIYNNYIKTTNTIGPDSGIIEVVDQATTIE
jgi:hypothetical protein